MHKISRESSKGKHCSICFYSHPILPHTFITLHIFSTRIIWSILWCFCTLFQTWQSSFTLTVWHTTNHPTEHFLFVLHGQKKVINDSTISLFGSKTHPLNSPFYKRLWKNNWDVKQISFVFFATKKDESAWESNRPCKRLSRCHLCDCDQSW